MPIVLSKTLKVLGDIHVNINDKIILNALLAKTFQMVSSKHITYNESGRIKIPNWFALMFMQSGGGKDWLIDDLDNFVFSKYHNWYKDEINKFYENQLEELKSDPKNAKLTPKGLKAQKIVEELQDATQEGLYRLAQLTKNTDFGNIFIKMSEFGLYIKNSGKQEQKFLSVFCQLYDCKIPAKIIKSEGFVENIENIPINILAYSSFVLFNTDIWGYFNTMLEAGLCRRFQVSFQREKDKIFVARTDEEVTQLYQTLSELSNEYFDIFEKIQHGSCYKLLPEAKDVFNEYCIGNNEEYNKEEILLCKDEIQSRCHKIIKLACLYACLNHPQELVINMIDIKQAIQTVEYLSRGFREFYFHRPKINDKYQKAYDFLKRKIDRAYTKTALVNIFQKECGFSREKLRKSFENTICPVIQEIANSEGYTLVSDDSRCKNGAYYYLQKNSDIMPKSSMNVSELIRITKDEEVKKSIKLPNF